MSLHITEDLVLGASYKFTKTGPTLVRLFDVAGLTPGKQTLAQAASAVDAVSNARIPRYGEPHPAVPNLYAIEIEAEPVSGSRTAARVKVQYGTPEQAAVPGAVRIRIGGAGGHKLLAQLPDGSLAVVKYTDPARARQPAAAFGKVQADGQRLALAGRGSEDMALPRN